MEGKRIVIASHNTKDSENVVGQVVEWMKEMRGKADATLLYVIDEEMVEEASLADNGTFLGYEERKNLILRRAIKEGRAYLEGLEQVYGQQGIPVKAKIRVGRPSTEIVKEAKAQGAYAVIIGTHSRSRLSKSILGSITSDVICASPCPVIVFTPKVLKLTDRVKRGISFRFQNFDAFLSSLSGGERRVE
jgi:nucleotide-binding universal stress UspA family protein